MRQPQLPLNSETSVVNLRPRLYLSEVERLIKQHRIVTPCLSRNTLIRMCESGVLETPGGGTTTGRWQVYEDSFWRWARGESMQLAA